MEEVEEVKEVEEVEEVEVEHLLVGVLCAGNEYTNSRTLFYISWPLMYISVKTTLPHTYACCTYAVVGKVIFIRFDKF